jgi:hypothetical protein
MVPVPMKYLVMMKKKSGTWLKSGKEHDNETIQINQ